MAQKTGARCRSEDILSSFQYQVNLLVAILISYISSLLNVHHLTISEYVWQGRIVKETR